MIIGSAETFLDVRAWYAKLAILEHQVCHIEINRKNGPVYTTGFLVGPDIVLTTYHTMEFVHSGTSTEHHSLMQEDAEDVVVRFDYAISENGQELSPGVKYTLSKTDWLVAHSLVGVYTGEGNHVPKPSELDFALLRISTSPGLDIVDGTSSPRGWIELLTLSYDIDEDIKVGSPMTILQHPSGRPLQISIDTHAVTGFNENRTRIFYTTQTLPGSSGAPCFDINWRLIAMHQGSDNIVRRNRGIPIHLILKFLGDRDLLDVVSQEPPRRPIIGPTIQETLFAYDQSPLDPFLKALIAQGESQHVEFKETACRDILTGKRDQLVVNQILKTVAGFMNSEEGGTLLIGVADSGEIVGINDDYSVANPQKRNWDGYNLWLEDVLTSKLEIENPFHFYGFTRYSALGKDICSIYVQPTSRPVYVNKRLYLRTGNKTRELRGPDLVDYVAKRWLTNK